MVKSNTYRDEALEHLLNNAAIPDVGDVAGLQPSAAVGNLYLAMHTAYPGRGGTQDTSEATYTGYAREAVPRDGTGFSAASGEITLTPEVLFGERTDDALETLRFWSLGKESTGVTDIVYLGHLGDDPTPFTSDLTTDQLELCEGHGLADDDEVVVYDVAGDSALPTGLVEGTVYFVINLSGNTAQLSATQGGAAINLTTSGCGLIGKVRKQEIKLGDRPRLSAGTVLHKED